MSRIERVRDRSDLPAALERLGVATGHPVLVSIGGAGGMSPDDLRRLGPIYAEVTATCARLDAVVVDGGTDAGVMKMMGAARGDGEHRFALIGVVADGTVQWDTSSPAQTAPLEEHHTHFVIVPGTDWGDESPWIAPVARAIAAGQAVVGLLIGGGEISRRDVQHLLDEEFPVIAVAGTGELADALASSPVAGEVEAIRANALTRVVARAELADTLRDALQRGA